MTAFRAPSETELAGVDWVSSISSTAARTASGSSGCSSFSLRISRHSASLASAPSAVRNQGTKVAQMTPSVRPTSSITSSGTLRGTSQSERAFE